MKLHFLSQTSLARNGASPLSSVDVQPTSQSNAAKESQRSFLPVAILRAILTRLAFAVPALLVVTFLTFALLTTLGDPAAAVAGDSATPEQLAIVREQLGLDRPLIVQYISWLGDALQGNFGLSFQGGVPVSDLLSLTLPVTLWLSLFAMVFALAFSLFAGFVAGLKPGSFLDRALTGFSILGMAIPNFIVGLILVLFFSVWLGWLPGFGYVPPQESVGEWIRHLILPASALALGLLAQQLRTLRASIIKESGADYVRTARAKGLSEGGVVVKHVTRNSLLPLVAVVGLQVGRIVSGAIFVETVFSLPGVGNLTVNAVLTQDYPVVLALVMVFGAVILIANLVVDLLTEVISPITRSAK